MLQESVLEYEQLVAQYRHDRFHLLRGHCSLNAVVGGSELGLSMAVGTNGFVLNRRKLEEILPHLSTCGSTFRPVNAGATPRAWA
jgi:hypothetical protein